MNKGTYQWRSAIEEVKMNAGIRKTGSYLSWFLRAGCFYHFVLEYVYEFSLTGGESMLPTMQNNSDWVHAVKSYRLGRGIDMGDCIVALKPTDPYHYVCKRITGMPGDVILVDPSSSSELTNTPTEIIKHDGFNKYIKVPEGHVWVTGDNLSASLDSRSYSCIPMGLIKGKIVAVNSANRGLTNEEGKLWFWNFRKMENSFIDK